eukprot:TRINITY_DN61296_c0_g1_i1.p1 TRINITY_DN61296_c0_g1~~TRINITY_DN61296_c0_g1_i1.p1  ORF type:complete len:140 (+),score=34.54 TRINITY_DN61296_c0_g1_i1:308-727(+)
MVVAGASEELQKTCAQLAGAEMAAEVAQELAETALRGRDMDVATLKIESGTLRKPSLGVEAASSAVLRSGIARIEALKDNSDVKQESNVRPIREDLASSKDSLHDLPEDAAKEIRARQKEMDWLCAHLIAARDRVRFNV